jgi:hypothetical protein
MPASITLALILERAQADQEFREALEKDPIAVLEAEYKLKELDPNDLLRTVCAYDRVADMTTPSPDPDSSRIPKPKPSPSNE